MNGSSNSCLIMTATVPIAPPSASEPTSPMKTSAGCALYQRNPMAEPDHRAAKNRQLANLRHALQFEVGGEIARGR